MPGSLPAEQIMAPVDAALRGAGFELVTMKLVPRGGATVVQIFIDHAEGEGGVTLGDCTRASRVIQERLDLDRLLPGRYVLEVSSPGVDRPLTRPEHYRRFCGEQVVLRLAAERRGLGVLRGVIVDADHEGVTVELEGGERERLRFAEIAGAHLKVEVWKARKGQKSPEPEGMSDPA